LAEHEDVDADAALKEAIRRSMADLMATCGVNGSSNNNNNKNATTTTSKASPRAPNSMKSPVEDVASPAPVQLAKHEDVDAALKEAIRRSMADLMATCDVNGSNNNKNATTTSNASTRAANSMKSPVEDVADKVVRKMERVAHKVSQSARKLSDQNDKMIYKLQEKLDRVAARSNSNSNSSSSSSSMAMNKLHASLDAVAKHVTQSMEKLVDTLESKEFEMSMDAINNQVSQVEQMVANKRSKQVATKQSVTEAASPTPPPVQVPKDDIVESPLVEKIVIESNTTVQQAPGVVVDESATAAVVAERDDDEDDSKPKAVQESTSSTTTTVGVTAAGVATIQNEDEDEIVVEPIAPCVAEVATTDTTMTPMTSTFALDAAGSGDVAADLGATMDKIVTAIQDMKDELDRSSGSSDCNKNNSNINNVESVWDTESYVDAQDSSDDDDDDDDNEEEETAVMETQAGATILSGEETHNKDEDGDDNDDASGSNNSWMVVHDQTITSDEAFARAAQVIGSALFNSDMSRSAASGNISAMSHSSQEEEGTSTHSKNNVAVSVAASSESASSSSEADSQVSFVDSVPTDIPSLASANGGGGGGGTPVVAQAQLDRWVLQLSQLHELGFYNDAICVDILERLQAANVGSGEEEEVTVTQVINELMREW
jgi:trimeric autotransporter adhesin